MGMDKFIAAEGTFTITRAADAAKYSPDQPRAPAGSPEGGQWTDGDNSEGSTWNGGVGEQFPDNPLTAGAQDWHREKLIGDMTGKGPLGGVHIRDDRRMGGWYLSELRAITPGGGRVAMSEVIRLADKHGQTIRLFALPMESYAYGGSKLSRAKLVRWYEGFGFESDGKPYDGGQSMIRRPKGPLRLGSKTRTVEIGKADDDWFPSGPPMEGELDEILEALRVVKYDPNQPRAPKGDPRGGQWIASGPRLDDSMIPMPPDFMTDEEMWTLIRSDDPDKEAKFKAEEEKRLKWTQDTWEERKKLWALRDKIQDGGIARPPLPFSDSPEPKFVRFGDIPEGEQSTVWAAPNVFAAGMVGQKEDGVSVYRVKYNADRNLWQIDDSLLTDGGYASIDELLAGQDEFDNVFVSGGTYWHENESYWVPPVTELQRNENRRPMYLLTGDEVGEGIDGEPVIRNVRTLATISAADVLHEGYFDPKDDLDPIRNPTAYGLSFAKFDPNQPRHPKGTPLGGQWRDTNASGGPSVLFEVAPNPDDKELTARWDSLDDDQKLAITREIAEDVTPKVLQHYGVEGKLVETIGGFEGKVNPSLELQLTSEGSETLVASALGQGLSQKSMVIASASPLEGLGPVAGAAIIVPPNERSMAGVKAIFERAAKVPGVDSFTYRNGQIEILNFTGVDADTFGDQINDSLDNAYRVKQSQIYSTLLEGSAYASGESDSGGISGGQYGDSLRGAVQASLDERLRRFGKRAEEEAEGWAYPLEILKWDESKHPRWPAGDSRGGEFAPKDGAGGGDPTDILDPQPTLDEPIFEYTGDYRMIQPEKDGIPISTRNLPPQYLAVYDPDDGKIYMTSNDVRQVDLKGLHQKTVENHAIGHWSAPHPNQVIWHEIGHAKAHALIGSNRATNYMIMPETVWPEFNSLARRVSDYAATNGNEFIAEVYAGRRSGKVYDEEVMGLYRQMLTRKD